MISLDLAQRLKAAGVPWEPSSGDRFAVPDRDLDGEVFVVSEMVVEVHHLPVGPLLGFNGTTEWALDSILAREVVWLPTEAQLRELLGDRFLSLQATPGGFIVEVTTAGLTDAAGPGQARQRHIDIDAECAYARAVLSLLPGLPDADPRQDQ